MRFLVFVTLFFYCIFNLHIAFDKHVQVFCVEKNGHSSVETYDLTQWAMVNASQSTPLESDKLGNCEDCTDYFIGTGHPDNQGFFTQNPENFNNSVSFDLQKISLTLTPQPLAAILNNTPLPAYPPPLVSPSKVLLHIPSTVLLI